MSAYGSGTDAKGKTGYSINARCLHDVDVTTLTRKPWDGKSH